MDRRTVDNRESTPHRGGTGMSWWPFGKRGSGTGLSPDVERIFEKMSRLLEDETAQNNALPENFRQALLKNRPSDKVANGFGEFGRTLTNPVPVNGPVGELLYLSQLETVDGVAIAFHRLGAHDDVDIFEVLTEDGRDWDLIYLTLYYPRKSKAMPAGYRKMEDRGRSSLVRGTTLSVEGFPNGIYGAAIENTKRIFGMSIADPRLKSFEQIGVARPDKHLVALRQLKFSSQTPPRTGGATQRPAQDHDPLLTLFDETFELWKLHIEKTGREIGVSLRNTFDRELSYLLLYVMTTLLFKRASRQDPTLFADRLTKASLTRLASREGVQVGVLVEDYRVRFEGFRRIQLFTTSDRVLLNEGALVLGRQLTGEPEMVFGTIVTSIVTATLTPLRDALVSVQ